MSSRRSNADTIRVGSGEVPPEALVRVARGCVAIRLERDPVWRGKIRASRAALESALGRGETVYGVSTGVGNDSSRPVSAARQRAFAKALMRQHGCGVGEPFGEEESRAIVFARLVGLSKGYSGVRFALLDAMCRMLNSDVTPAIPRLGSVGASGDLTPLSYVAAALAGEREVLVRGRRISARRGLAKAGLVPFEFAPKETLGIMNGTSAMTAVGILAIDKIRRLVAAAERATALAAEVLRGRSQAFHPLVHRVKPHRGQAESAAAIRAALAGSGLLDPDLLEGRPVQDRYSIRCAPQVLGAARDGLAWGCDVLRRELNSANDNPIADPDSGRILFGGNFYGGHVALALDLAKLCAASVVDMVDRQFALLVDSHHNMGIPETLVAYDGSGVKGLQITCSALAALSAQRSAPDVTLSRSTECANQDKVSMGLHAALNAAEIAGFLAAALAAELIAISNAARFRDESLVSPSGRRLLDFVRSLSPPLEADRRLDLDIARIADIIARSPMPTSS